ncbi:ankyrin repeat domain-containing protein [Flavobacterium sp. J49]|uniref:ankyrin repeat domain-containing protein n=1 Tax=Flavobacterium sp. J49 TaxID=2718534 RepID=UPI0015937D08|nr:ankyrin repeat domain-containing protein [Flavobacterium sp. J49]MBF6640028.1 ankyrin repeat domain-containing protein [Flavobacterium sp. J49]NIC01273.1 ankyrin repeat domain-containing protein [Flavobacterium sp. J49]
MKKTIIFAGLALVAFTNVALATNVSKAFPPTEVTIYEVTPLCNAIVKGDLTTVKKFIEYGSDVNESMNGVTPLMLAARYNKVEIIKVLLEKGARPDAKDDKGFTALKYAEISKANEAAAYLKQI